ncbi:helix-turn-helix domain-containing protein [Polynucleobacter paneuropaeus]|uniref:Helix-turn-helix domain-containing protein n=1 Tax=Polynucleobacter paneuropaeus TaxID=2527775 RepID=A0A9Q2WFH8_9BURK|nr:helix-turn-helix domain-containing protein [Polynucleobacter paneuropaeus]MBT8550439.1 helix-turn-helix domain-containing protein [Polynucleobacter paneuropaeus]MBT8585498.1 helix-turn-helix domain-containing protein [Polynucleobacter paneuropaeus]QWD35872.1 helix-turn-helix domain-containing protein [Polynucleobacter paneuropaeus]QWD37735.1 helix-turn-helix domain-containing protein [Polynucleobacter paneuropaeus]
MKVKNTIPEIRKEVFVKAREALGLSVQELSGKACLSVRQIQQIENGEHNSFYSPNIKFTAAKKVAQLLDLQTEEAFDFGDLVSQLPIEVQEAKPSPAVVEEKPKTKTPEPASNIKVESAALAKSIQQKKPASSSPDKKPWLPILAFIAIAGFAFLSLRPSLFGTASETAQAPAEEVKAEAPVSPAEPSAQAAPEKAAEPTPTPAVVAAPVAVASTPSATECPMADSNVASYKTDAPKKSADMVYLVAKTPQVVCVLDATGKSQSKQLEPGIGASIYGKAPLKVLTAGLSQVDLYFQGVKVRPGNAGNTILLEPAPLSANKNDSDSELR